MLKRLMQLNDRMARNELTEDDRVTLMKIGWATIGTIIAGAVAGTYLVVRQTSNNDVTPNEDQ